MDLRIFTEPQQGATYDTLLTVAKATEDLGFDAFFRSDHYLRMGSSDGLPGPTDAWITLAGLAREVQEETGLVVTDWTGPLYEIVAEAPGLGWRLRVEAWLALDFEGELHVDDPDGIVVDARFVCIDDCPVHLTGGHPWVTEPLSEWLAEHWEGKRTYGYKVDGNELRSLVVTRM